MAIQKDVEENYREMINESVGPVHIWNVTFDPADILYELDPIAYNVGYSDYQDSYSIWECEKCNEEYDDEDDANNCCEEEE